MKSGKSMDSLASVESVDDKEMSIYSEFEDGEDEK